MLAALFCHQLFFVHDLKDEFFCLVHINFIDTFPNYLADVNRFKNLWQMFGNDTSINGFYSIYSLRQLLFMSSKQIAYKLGLRGINFATNLFNTISTP